LHPLIVHATVVFVPLSVLGALVVVLVPAARRRYGSLVVVTAVVATVCTVLAEESGEALEHTLPPNPRSRRTRPRPTTSSCGWPR
jgi:uncharacterized membrane protein